ncbi:hypothetical protein P691DRAFT_802533 [Macrolepiota fuliginosa MF-IS2]|uniref:DUF6534 domain-containing protein n=1 Tax=Macrolepiota fuliginosa MF-IS2 TaxID=1400762 RepID=A0A9P5XD59_9AGAR|nr:hypothetical protein P691DRAFT_802533 [Macrolepiota fuliginosa MF-IS2]
MNTAPQGTAIGDTYGAGYIGVIVTAALYGLTTLQTYFYYVHYPDDRFGLKALVSLIWVLDSLHMAIVSYSIYYYLVTNYSNPIALGVGHWSLFISIGLNLVIVCTVQCFFTRKIHILCESKLKWFVTTLIGLSVLAHFAFGIEIIVLMFIKKELALLSEITLIAVTPFSITSILSDIFIAGALCFLLHGRKTGFKNTNTIVSRLIIYAINRCLLTSVAAVVELIAFSASPHTLWYLAIDFTIGKLYTNSLLVSLNGRQSIRDAGSPANATHLSDLEFGGASTSRVRSDVRLPVSCLHLFYHY